MAVFVLDRRKRPLMPCSEKRARLLLERRRAVVHRRYPFVIRLKDRRRVDCDLQPVRVVLGPGSRTTGIVVAREAESVDIQTGAFIHKRIVLLLMELNHRGPSIRDALTRRRAFRRRRRRGGLRYRAPRFDNRSRHDGWLPPSLQHRVDTTLTWVARLVRWAPVTGISQMLHRFDTQKLQNPKIQSIEYQRGELHGYEVREYLLEKWRRECAYCGTSDVPLTIDHIHPKSRGGSDRVSNLTLACVPCNQRKSNRDVREFLSHDSVRLARIEVQRKSPLRDAAAVNSTRQALYGRLKTTGLPLETGTGGRTKWNRHRLGVPKTHCLDAACIGRIDSLERWRCPIWQIKATGRGAYCRTRLTRYGFPRGYLMRQKSVHGFQTGDRVCAVVPSGKKVGEYAGRVAVRASGSFNIQTPQGVVQGIHHSYCRLLQRGDGYGYHLVAQPKKEGGNRGACRASRAIPPRRERRGLPHKPMNKQKKVVVCGVTGCGDTIHAAKDDAIEQIGKVMDRLRENPGFRLVAWRGYVGLVYMSVAGATSALIAEPNYGFRIGRVQSCMTFDARHSLDDAERAMRRDIAQLAWQRYDGTAPPEVIQHDGDLREFQDWARWQIAFRAAKDDGASDDEARAAASNRDESHDAEVLDTAGPTP